MTDTLLDPLEALAAELELDDDDGHAAREHLEAGRSIYYAEDDTPPGHVIKHYPDGRRELIQMERDVDHFVRAL